MYQEIYHVCTNGNNHPVVYTCSEDYRTAILISASTAYKYHVTMLCFVHMSNHSHFIIRCKDIETAKTFIEEYKKVYAMYFQKKHNVSGIFRRVSTCPKRIGDLLYLRNCIAYVLMNPVTARIVRNADEYKWSSIHVYFKTPENNGFPVNMMKVRQVNGIFHTHTDLRGSNYMIDSDGNLLLRSFVDYKSIEGLYKSVTNLYKSLLFTDCLKEEEIYSDKGHHIAYNDNELLREAEMIASKRYNIGNLNLLTKNQKLTLLIKMRNKYRASDTRLARILSLDVNDLQMLQ